MTVRSRCRIVRLATKPCSAEPPDCQTQHAEARPELARNALKLNGSCQAGRSFPGSIAASFSSSTRNTVRIPHRKRRHEGNLRALDSHRGRIAGGADDRRAAPEGRRRGQPRAVDPPLRPSRRPDRSARQRPPRRSVAARRRRTASPTTICARCRRRLIAGPLSIRRDRPPTTRSSLCGGSTARRPATTSRTSSCPRSATGCARRSRPAAFARRPIRSTRSRCSIG